MQRKVHNSKGQKVNCVLLKIGMRKTIEALQILEIGVKLVSHL